MLSLFGSSKAHLRSLLSRLPSSSRFTRPRLLVNTPALPPLTLVSPPQSRYTLLAFPARRPLLTFCTQTFADGFIAVVAQYTPANGGLAEQYTRAAGVPTSALDLTWSYAAALTAFNARAGFVPTSWGAKGLTVPSTCQTGGATPGNPGSGSVAVTFNEKATTVYGENIYLTGSVDALKNWSPDNALLLPNPNYPTWSSA
jgi:hypothetical protein